MSVHSSSARRALPEDFGVKHKHALEALKADFSVKESRERVVAAAQAAILQEQATAGPIEISLGSPRVTNLDAPASPVTITSEVMGSKSTASQDASPAAPATPPNTPELTATNNEAPSLEEAPANTTNNTAPQVQPEEKAARVCFCRKVSEKVGQAASFILSPFTNHPRATLATSASIAVAAGGVYLQQNYPTLISSAVLHAFGGNL